jgi:hypothetical protein
MTPTSRSSTRGYYAIGHRVIPIVGYILVLANRRGLTDQQVRRLSPDDVRDLADRGTRSADTVEEEARRFG